MSQKSNENQPFQGSHPLRADEADQLPDLSISADIRQAHTLPAAFYRSKAAHRQLIETVFAGSWQFTAHTSDLESVDLFPVVLLPKSLDEPLLLSRREDGWRCLSNVCTHRGHLLISEPCKGNRIRCRYHGRTFDRDGGMCKAPGFEQALNFPSANDNLPELPLQEIGGLLFTVLEKQAGITPDFDQFMAPVYERISADYLRSLRARTDLDADYPVQANWALYCDNYLEGFHIPYVHPALNRLLDFGAYRTECFDGGTLQVGIAREGEPAFEPATSGPDAGKPVAAFYFFLFPNLMLNFYPWGLSINIVEPQGLKNCLVRFRSFVANSKLLEQSYNIDEVQREDEEVVHSVQQGIHSRLYQQGRFSPDQESGVHHFHSMIARSLNRK